MKDLIIGVLVELTSYKNVNTIEEDAEKILKTVEDAGMTPPEYDSMPGSDWAVNKRQWEEENA